MCVEVSLVSENVTRKKSLLKFCAEIDKFAGSRARLSENPQTSSLIGLGGFSEYGGTWAIRLFGQSGAGWLVSLFR